jgi:hypothetical protein
MTERVIYISSYQWLAVALLASWVFPIIEKSQKKRKNRKCDGKAAQVSQGEVNEGAYPPVAAHNVLDFITILLLQQ